MQLHCKQHDDCRLASWKTKKVQSNKLALHFVFCYRRKVSTIWNDLNIVSPAHSPLTVLQLSKC